MESAFKLKRIAATVILVVALIMTFVAAFVLPAILCIIFVIVRPLSSLKESLLTTQIQYLAYLWVRLDSRSPMARVSNECDADLAVLFELFAWCTCRKSVHFHHDSS